MYSFLAVCLSGLGIKVMLTSENEFESVPLSFLGDNLRRIGVNFSLYIW